jgi:Streptomycin adenylyltransferase
MTESLARARFREHLLQTVKQDERIVGVLTSGSACEGRVDQWSDIDAFLFLRDEDFDLFLQHWQTWATQLGQILLAYHPDHNPRIAWTIYHAEPIPLRVDFRMIHASEAASVSEWPAHPTSVENMVWYDNTDGRLSEAARILLHHSLRLPQEEEKQTFEEYTGKMWYFLHSASCKLERGNQWYARVTFHLAVLDSLMALLKLEIAATERWQASFPEWNIEKVLTPTRLAQLNACIPLPGAENLKQALARTAQLGYDVCEAIANQHEWEWSHQAAKEIILMLE